jgi:hypothetical protein
MKGLASVLLLVFTAAIAQAAEDWDYYGCVGILPESFEHETKLCNPYTHAQCLESCAGYKFAAVFHE